MDAAHIDVAGVLRRLNLSTVARMLPEYDVRAATENWTHHEFVTLLLAEEVAHRKDARIKKLTRAAHFPSLKTIEEFDFTFQSSLRRQQLGPYLGSEFVTEGRNLILSGRPGRGKAHLGVALAYKAIQNDFEARFVTAAALIDELHAAAQAGALPAATARYARPHVLVIDEVGYLSCAEDAANVLYGVVDHRCIKKRPIIFTTNKPLSTWGSLLHDKELADAILDRVMERGEHVVLGGRSWRTRGADPATFSDGA